jgi:hypothetical protein
MGFSASISPATGRVQFTEAPGQATKEEAVESLLHQCALDMQAHKDAAYRSYCHWKEALRELTKLQEAPAAP